jgi:hypothetical protein
MLPTLLWRCPICRIDDALVHRHRRFRPDLIACRACDSRWELHRVIGGTDYRLKAVAGPMAGAERPLAEWYDMMRAGFELIPISNSKLPLEPGEALYVSGQPVALAVLRKDPRFQEAIAEIPQLVDSAEPALAGRETVNLGPVDLFLTDRRLIVRRDGRRYDLPLRTIRAVQLVIDRFLVIRHAGQLMDLFEFAEESPLKWRAYLALALRPIAEAYGHQVRMAYD